jgi:hypothetical protein
MRLSRFAVLVAVGAVFAGGASAASGATKSLEVLGHSNPGVGANGDVYGHRGYAYLGSWIGSGCLSNGVRTYDLQNPREPRHVSTFADKVSDPSLAGTWTEKIVVQHVNTSSFVGDLAVVSVQACSRSSSAFRGFALYDVTNPWMPAELSRFRTEQQTGGSHEIWLQNKGNRAYVYTAIPSAELLTSPDGVTPGNPDFRIIDVSDPRNPVQVGAWGAWRNLGVHPNPPGPPSNFTHSVIVNGTATRAYLSYWDLGTVILDITNPAAPTFIGRTEILAGEPGNAHSAWLARGGNVLVETHEMFSSPGSSQVGVPTIHDISDEANPTRLSRFTRPDLIDLGETVHDPKVLGSRLFLSWYQEGVVVLDISRPASPELIAKFNPPAEFTNPDYGFCLVEPCTSIWGVFPDRDYILASGESNGLWVLKLR